MSADELADERDDMRVLVPGLKAYDADGNLLGTVESIDRTIGTIWVAANPFFEEPLMVRLRTITAMNAREVYLSCTRKELGNNGPPLDHLARGEEARR